MRASSSTMITGAPFWSQRQQRHRHHLRRRQRHEGLLRRRSGNRTGLDGGDHQQRSARSRRHYALQSLLAAADDPDGVRRRLPRIHLRHEERGADGAALRRGAIGGSRCGDHPVALRAVTGSLSCGACRAACECELETGRQPQHQRQGRQHLCRRRWAQRRRRLGGGPIRAGQQPEHHARPSPRTTTASRGATCRARMSANRRTHFIRSRLHRRDRSGRSAITSTTGHSVRAR